MLTNSFKLTLHLFKGALLAWHLFKGALSGLRPFLTTENPFNSNKAVFLEGSFFWGELI